jgi:hypothetical protein
MSIITNLELQNKFNTATKNSLNRHTLITFEIREIEEHINTIPANTRAFRKMTYTSTVNASKKIFDFSGIYIDRKVFNESFYQYLNNGTPITIERLYNDNDEIYNHKQNSADQAFELFTYYKWLNELLTSPQKAEKKNLLSHKQKILALHYLGFNMMKFNQTKTGLVLEEVLGLNAKNTTDYIRHVSDGKNEVRTLENLNKVSQLFEKQGLHEVADKINAEIQKIIKIL